LCNLREDLANFLGFGGIEPVWAVLETATE